jgi:uncharacterized protein DUF1064
MSNNKYGAIKVKADGFVFDSKMEYAHYCGLKLRRTAGEIVGEIKVHPKFPLVVCGVKICTFISDFEYYDAKIKDTVIDEVKGFVTPSFRIKIKLFKALYPNARINVIYDAR